MGRTIAEQLPKAVKGISLSTMTPLTVYCDGGFLRDVQVGAWAFYIPEFDIRRCGAAEGMSSHRFELEAAVRGIECAAESEPHRPIVIATDCEFVVKWIEELALRYYGQSARKRMPPHDRKLMDRLVVLMGSVSVSAYCVSSVVNGHHAICHEMASAAIAEYVKRDDTFVLYRDRGSREAPWAMRMMQWLGLGRVLIKT